IEAQTELDFGWLCNDTERGARLRRFQAGRRAALAATIGPDSLAEHEFTAADLTAEQISMLTLSRPALFADAELHGRVAELQRLERLIAEVAEFDLLTAQLDRIDEGLAKGLAADVDAVFAATVAPDGAAADAEPAIGTVEHLWQPAERNCFVRSGLGVYEAAGGTAPAKLRGHVTGPAGVLAGESFDLLDADPREGGYRDLAAVAAHVKQTGDAVLVVVGFRGFTDASRPGSHAVQAFWDGEFDTRPNGTRVPVPGTGEVVVIDNGERSVFADWAAGQTGIRSVSGWEIMQGGTPRRPLVDGKSRAVAGLDYDNVGIAGRRTSLTDNTGLPNRDGRSGIEPDRGGEPSARDPAPENPGNPGRTITRPGAAEPVPAALTAEEAARVQQLYTAYSKPVLAQLVPRAGGDRELVRTVLQNTFLRLAGEIAEPDGGTVDLPGRAVDLALDALEYAQFRRGFDEFRQRMWAAATTDRARTALAAATMSQIWQALGELPVSWRRVTLLRYLGGMDFPTVAEVMDCAGSLVEAMLRDAMRQMSTRLTEQMDEAATSPAPQPEQPKTRQPTLADIARAAGVSTSTVHFAVNEREIPNISRETSERVRRIAVEMGYPVGKKVDRAAGVPRANTLVDESEATGVNLSTLSRARSGRPISEKTRQQLADSAGGGVVGKPRATLAEVAQRAGTSVTTASRVLRNEPQPEGVTRRVMAAIAELGYAASVYTRRAPEPASPARWSPPRRGGGGGSAPGFGRVDAFEEPYSPEEALGL
ncbi:MAG: LacI family DNA-binding transcriptional regulator, partial [Nocardia sp.]|nr:LacI family DNA-binding transcriptional regulator [Nocardia sp.]